MRINQSKAAFPNWFICCALFLMGCSSVPTRDAFYPNFAKQLPHLNKVYILGDFLEIKDSISGQYIDLPETLESGRDVINSVASNLRKRGFDPVGSDIICSGCFISGNTTLYPVLTDRDFNTGKTTTSFEALPFYVNPRFAESTDKKAEIAQLLSQLGNSWKSNPADPNATIPDLVHLESISDKDLIVFVIGLWHDQTRSKFIVGQLASAALSSTLFHLPIVDSGRRVVKLSFYVVDAKSGELIWTDGMIQLTPNLMGDGPLFNEGTQLVDRLPGPKANGH